VAGGHGDGLIAGVPRPGGVTTLIPERHRRERSPSPRLRSTPMSSEARLATATSS
jgi:hypothetical protein